MCFQIKFTNLSSLAGLLLASNLESSFKTTTRPSALMTELDRFQNSNFLFFIEFRSSYSLNLKEMNKNPLSPSGSCQKRTQAKREIANALSCPLVD